MLTTWRLSNSKGMEVTIGDFGARVLSIKVPDRQGELVEMTLNHQSEQDILNDSNNMGTAVGRVCNRIGDARFTVNGCEYQVDANMPPHCLHGGRGGLATYNWSLVSQTDNALKLSVTSIDGDQGFPGNLDVEVQYRLDDDNCLHILFAARSDQDTPVNLCNHCYFHLGADEGRQLELQLAADHYLPADQSVLPTGEIAAVEGTPFDFRRPVMLADALRNSHPQSAAVGGIDHCMVLNDAGNSLQAKAILRCADSGFELKVFTDQPGMQLYTAQHLGGTFKPFQAVCLESQGFPDAINQSAFPSVLLKAGESYQAYCGYQFHCKED